MQHHNCCAVGCLVGEDERSFLSGAKGATIKSLIFFKEVIIEALIINSAYISFSFI